MVDIFRQPSTDRRFNRQPLENYILSVNCLATTTKTLLKALDLLGKLSILIQGKKQTKRNKKQTKKTGKLTEQTKQMVKKNVKTKDNNNNNNKQNRQNNQ